MAYTIVDFRNIVSGRFGPGDFVECPRLGCTSIINPVDLFNNITSTRVTGGLSFAISDCPRCGGSVAIFVTDELRLLIRDELGGPSPVPGPGR